MLPNETRQRENTARTTRRKRSKRDATFPSPRYPEENGGRFRTSSIVRNRRRTDIRPPPARISIRNVKYLDLLFKAFGER